jgi:hypothetical protein
MGRLLKDALRMFRDSTRPAALPTAFSTMNRVEYNGADRQGTPGSGITTMEKLQLPFAQGIPRGEDTAQRQEGMGAHTRGRHPTGTGKIELTINHNRLATTASGALDVLQRSPHRLVHLLPELVIFVPPLLGRVQVCRALVVRVCQHADDAHEDALHGVHW